MDKPSVKEKKKKIEERRERGSLQPYSLYCTKMFCSESHFKKQHVSTGKKRGEMLYQRNGQCITSHSTLPFQ